jgi:type IV pilus assembly protein PilM
MPVKRTVVALDIGSSGLRAAQFSLGKQGPVLEKYGAAPLPLGTVQAGVVVDGATVSQTLKSLWSDAKFTGKRVVFGIANDGVLVRQLDLDWMEPSDFRKALQFHVADFIPMAVEDANLDYHVLGEFDAPGDNGDVVRMVRILLVAAARDMVDEFVRAVRGAGLQPVKADLVPFALIRASRPAATEPDTVEAIVDLGADTLAIVVHQAGQPRFVRMVANLGGNQITAALEAEFGWPHDDAERAKIEFGLPARRGPGPDSAAVDPGLSAAAPRVTLDHPVHQVVDKGVSAFVAEVRTTLEFFLSSSGDVTRLSRLVLAGAGSLMSGLQERFADELRVPVEHLAPLAAVSKRRRVATGAEDEAQLAVLAGLAVGVA